MSEFPAAQAMLEEHRDIETQMSSPEVLARPEKLRSLGRRYAELNRVVGRYERWLEADQDVKEIREIIELGGEDAELFAAELPDLEAELEAAAEDLRDALLPRDPDDSRDAIMEIKAGEGGEESALFAADLLRMYQRYAESKGWSTQILSSTPTDIGGFKDVQIAVKAKSVPEDPAEGVWAHLKYEAGVHRVQRVPVTESQGRVHTSAAGVLVFAEVDEPEEVQINDNELRIDVYRSSGPGGQSVNTTDSAVRITHIPTGITVSMQDEKSQIKNREAAMRVLLARLRQAQLDELAAKEADARRSQVRTVDRSERVRTYNFPENRIADHRTGFKAHNLDVVLDGSLQPVIDSLREMDEQERLAQATGTDEK
ncbi:MAG: peptide chain release factor 1 [Actinomycetaceae bacterium]|nr:peptide chain release factor 1 [Actinomycetaceae bacterium]